MIEEIVKEMLELTLGMQDVICQDIEDVKFARHERLLARNEMKQLAMQQIVDKKYILNTNLATAYQNGIDINIYRDMVDNLETELTKLYQLNSRLGSIVLPVRQMYKQIVDEITENNGGVLYDVRA